MFHQEVMPPNSAFDATVMNYRKSDVAEVIEIEGFEQLYEDFPQLNRELLQTDFMNSLVNALIYELVR